MSDRVWFEVALETYCQEAKKRVSPSTQAKISAGGLSLDKPYPNELEADAFVPLVRLAVADAFPGLSDFEAQFKWGSFGADTYFTTFIGRGLLPLIRAFGPHRYLGSGKRLTRHANSFQNIAVEKLGPTKYRLTIDDAATGAMTFGGLYGSLTYLKLDGLSWKQVDAAAGSLAIEVEWK